MTDTKNDSVAGASAVTAPHEAPPTMAEYKKSQARVRELVEKRRILDRRLAQVEDGIAQKEAAYLESTPNGNIITGFDSYLKGTTGAASQRRKAGTTEPNRVFSRSSISYRPSNGDGGTPGSVGSTPSSQGPLSLSASFRENGSAGPTPSSAGGTKGSNKGKKKESEDSEGDVQTAKKRTNFGASRK